jgi:hypothetical protein
MKKMKLRPIAAVFMFAVLLMASLGGAVCEASCAPVSMGTSHHACCPAEMIGSKIQTGIGNPTACGHPAHEQASLLVAPVFVAPAFEIASILTPAAFIPQAALSSVLAGASPPVFHLRI